MKTLIVITGATASGKSALALELAKTLNTSIISADSRQIYSQIPIGTAAPTHEEQAAVPHFFVGTKQLDEYFSAWQFEKESLDVLDSLFTKNDYAIACGGSMLYIDALIKGLDELPTISESVRSKYQNLYNDYGLDYLLDILRNEDPEYFDIVDKRNHKRIIHALEIIEQSGIKYSSLRKGFQHIRPFKIVTFILDLPRPLLFERINKRVDIMIESGLENEVRSVYIHRELNSLNTVGYKELFQYFDGTMFREEAIEKIKRNTRVFAKKQLTWLKKYHDAKCLDGTLPIQELKSQILIDIGFPHP